MKRCRGCVCSKKRYLPQRYMVALMCMFGIIVGYGQRVCLNIAITEMTEKNASRGTDCPFRNTSFIKQQKVNVSGGIIPWTNAEQHNVIGSFYIGYFIAHIPAGLLCDYYGSRYVFSGGLGMSTILTFVTPIIVTSTPAAVAITLRIVVGVAQGVIYPAISVLNVRWIPLHERSFLGSFSLAANALGIIFGNFLTGSVIQLTANWPAGFYMWGFIGAIWCVIFIIYIYSEPASHPFIREEELTMLQEQIIKNQRMKTPWKSVLLSLPVWGLIAGELGHGFSIYTLMNSMPKYLHDVLHYEIAENALASSIPFTTQWFGAMVTGKVTDILIKRKIFSVVLLRRVNTTFGITVPALFIVLAGYMGCNGMAAIAMFGVSMLFKGQIYSGLKVNHLELSVNFAGILMALINGIGASSGFISPAIITVVAPNNTLKQWVLVFWVVFAIGAITNVFYWIVCTDKRQKWDIPKEEQGENADTKKAT